MSGSRWQAGSRFGDGNIWFVARICAFDAGKRKTNASKAFSKRQPARAETRAASRVGCLVVAEQQPSVQSYRALFPNGQGGGRSDIGGNPSIRQQRRRARVDVGMHLRAVYRWSVSAVLPSQLEGIDCGNLGADRQEASHSGVREGSGSRNPAGSFAGL